MTNIDTQVHSYEANTPKRPGLAPEIKSLALTPAEKQDLVAFMRTLTSADAPVQIPLLPR